MILIYKDWDLKLRIPKEFQKDPETRKFFENQQFWNFLMWKRAGGGNDIINESIDQPGVLTLIADINERLGSGQFLTSDTDSFTVDSTIFFTDMDEA